MPLADATMAAMSDANAADWTVRRLLEWTRDFFQQRELDAPRLSSEILLAFAMGCERINLYTRYETQPTPAQRDAFREMVRRAADGRPIAYLTGTKEFFGLAFAVDDAVLIPRPETEILVERTIHLARHGDGPTRRILDLGTGSGCIAVSLAAHLPDMHVAASDVSQAAVAIARSNAERHGLLDRIDFRVGDLFAPWNGEEPFDVILSNPPYVAESEADTLPRNVRDFEPHAALFGGSDGLTVIRRIAKDAANQLAHGGHLMVEIAYNQADAARTALDAAGWRSIVSYRDLARHERVLHARRAALSSTIEV